MGRWCDVKTQDCRSTLTAALFVVSAPLAAAVEVVGELIVVEVCGCPGLVSVLALPYVREGVCFEGGCDPHSSECVGGVLEGV